MALCFEAWGIVIRERLLKAFDLRFEGLDVLEVFVVLGDLGA